jgi:hypothetical protein
VATPLNMQAQSMIGDAELMAACRQGDAMNFDVYYEDEVAAAAMVNHRRQGSSQKRRCGSFGKAPNTCANRMGPDRS